jgi:hypothetical protein
MPRTGISRMASNQATVCVARVRDVTKYGAGLWLLSGLAGVAESCARAFMNVGWGLAVAIAAAFVGIIVAGLMGILIRNRVREWGIDYRETDESQVRLRAGSKAVPLLWWIVCVALGTVWIVEIVNSNGRGVHSSTLPWLAFSLIAVAKGAWLGFGVLLAALHRFILNWESTRRSAALGLVDPVIGIRRFPNGSLPIFLVDQPNSPVGSGFVGF